jgi:hypothetical protein
MFQRPHTPLLCRCLEVSSVCYLLGGRRVQGGMNYGNRGGT